MRKRPPPAQPPRACAISTSFPHSDMQTFFFSFPAKEPQRPRHKGLVHVGAAGSFVKLLDKPARLFSLVHGDPGQLPLHF